ncbi:pilus assembly protein PilZ, partial [Candidatus Pelagibacter sp.]|nr:pilus assembly protein PilZ [Candidatus Pelagibacter sp.]
LVTDHFTNQNFGSLIEPILNSPSDVGLEADDAEKEKEYLKRYRYEFFSINVGSSTFKGAGASLKKTSTNTQRQGTAYRIYGCGYLMPKGAELGEFEDPEILIPLETLIILSS